MLHSILLSWALSSVLAPAASQAMAEPPTSSPHVVSASPNAFGSRNTGPSRMGQSSGNQSSGNQSSGNQSSGVHGGGERAAGQADTSPPPTGEDNAGESPLTAEASEAASPDPSGEGADGASSLQTRSGDALKLLQVAVYDLEVSGVDKRMGKIVTDSVVVEIRKLKGVSVIGMAEIKAMLDHEAAMAVAGCDDESCLADLAGALGVDVIVIGTLAKVGDEAVVGMRRIDQRNASVAGSFQKRLPSASGQELLSSVGPAVETLFPDHVLKAGTERGVDEATFYRLDPPPIPAWAFWSSAVASGAILAGGAAFGLLNAAAWAFHLNYYASGSGPSAVSLTFGQIQLNRRMIDGTAYAAVALLAAGIVATGLTSVVALFTDFRGVERLGTDDLEEEAEAPPLASSPPQAPAPNDAQPADTGETDAAEPGGSEDASNQPSEPEGSDAEASSPPSVTHPDQAEGGSR